VQAKGGRFRRDEAALYGDKWGNREVTDGVYMIKNEFAQGVHTGMLVGGEVLVEWGSNISSLMFGERMFEG